MSPEKMRTFLEEVATGSLAVDEALNRLRHFPVEKVSSRGEVIGRVDTQRWLRQGFPEVILGLGKKMAHLEKIIEHALEHEGNLLITRVVAKRANRLRKRFPVLAYDPLARALYRQETADDEGLVVVLCAGTADVPVAAEAVLTARMFGARVVTHFDAGVAGLHRLLEAEELLERGRVFVVVAGMEGALPSVVGGLVRRPVIAVPTSQGYGASFGGLSALLAMLNSCASNVSVVNIDNGFGAGFAAGLINRWRE
ncbi:MAG: nickel pincer cofactor biosynthesis protein LarB [Magnetococcales bacterium]|nr:nickel pincer cofactor biosynthesis protein LarB [Magnetococcales bacterium]